MIEPASPVERIRAQFFVRSGEDMCAMMDGSSGGDFRTVEALAHRMVGAAGALEEDLIARLARDVMNRARSGDGTGVRLGLAALQEAFRERTTIRQGAAR